MPHLVWLQRNLTHVVFDQSLHVLVHIQNIKAFSCFLDQGNIRYRFEFEILEDVFQELNRRHPYLQGSVKNIQQEGAYGLDSASKMEIAKIRKKCPEKGLEINCFYPEVAKNLT